MRHRGPTYLGALLGLAAALLVIANVTPRGRPPEHGPMLGDFGGRIRTVVLQYTAGSQFVTPVYRQYLAQQSADLRVLLVCPEEADLAELQQSLGPVPPRLTPVYTHHAMTAWARDRWAPLLPLAGSARVTLLAPRFEDAGAWPQRAGDGRIAEDLAAAFPDRLTARRSGLAFDGGDFLADGQFLFATPAVLSRNLQQRVLSRDGLLEALAADTSLAPVLMDGAPDHHAGMFMMSAGPGPDGKPRMVVGDPSLARTLFDPAGPEAAELEGGPDVSPEMQACFDSVARLAAERGYAVTRIPTIVPAVGKNYIAYVNVLLDADGPQRIVYMPSFAGQTRLNAAASEVWYSLGFEVRAIDCSTVWTKGGTLHCLVNVLERDPR